MPHILFILDYYKPHLGWSETVFENIIIRLLRRWYKISIITSRFDSKLPKINQKDNCTVYRVWSGRVLFMISAFFFGFKFLRKNKDVKIIHTSTYWWAIPASLLWFFCKRKVFLTVHEIFGKLWCFYKWRIKWFFYCFFEKCIFFLNYDIYHCVSNYTMNSLRVMFGIPDHKINMIYNGVDTNFWDVSNVTEEEIVWWKKENWWIWHYVLLYYWHTWISKWIDYLVGALPDLVKNNPDIKIVFNLISAKRDNYIKWKIEDQKFNIEQDKKFYSDFVQVFNWFNVYQLRVLLASVDCVIAPSLSEWFGSVHTESCAMSKTLITTNIASLPEVVRWKVNFIKPRSIKEIVKWVEKVRKWDFELILQKNFSWDNTVDEIEKIYREL